MEDIPKYVINLERDKHKLIRFSKPMIEQNIDYKIWRGCITTNLIDLKSINKKYSFAESTNTLNNYGNVGSAFAHLSLWNYCLTQPSEYFMIFEDNCVIKENFKENVNYYLNKIMVFDFFNLNVIRPSGLSLDKKLFKYKKLHNFPYPPPNTWMSSYIISKKLMFYLLNTSRKINFDLLPIDKIIISLVNKKKKIDYYSLKTNYLTNHIELHTDTRKLLNKKLLIHDLTSYIATSPLNVS